MFSSPLKAKSKEYISDSDDSDDDDDDDKPLRPKEKKEKEVKKEEVCGGLHVSARL